MEVMLGPSAEPSVINCSTTIGACSKGQKWQRALQLTEGTQAWRGALRDLLRCSHQRM